MTESPVQAGSQCCRVDLWALGLHRDTRSVPRRPSNNPVPGRLASLSQMGGHIVTNFTYSS